MMGCRFIFKNTNKDLLVAVVCLIAACLGGYGTCAATEPSGAVVDVKAQSNVDQDMILLGDIAQIQAADTRLAAGLKNVTIGRSPLPGSTRNLSAGDVLVRLKQAGIDRTQVQLNMPQTARVSRKSVTIEADQIKKIVQGFVRQNLSDRRTQMTIADIRVPQKVVLPTGRVRYEVASGPGADMVGTFMVGVTFRVNESYQKKVWATVTVDAMVEAVVTVRALGRYKPITADDIEVRQIDLSDLPSNVISDPDEVIGKRTRRAIHSNRVLNSDMVELPPLVKRGDLVTIVAQFNGLKITTLGQVKKKGRQGERIPVINMDSKKVVFARVLDADTVAVDF